MWTYLNDHGVIFGSANFSVSGLETGLNDLILFPKSYSERFKEFFLNLWEYGKIGTVKGFLVSPVDNPERKGTQSYTESSQEKYTFACTHLPMKIYWLRLNGNKAKE